MGTLAFVLIWVSIDEIMLIFPPEYREFKYVVFWLGLANLINLSGGLSGQMIVHSSMYRVNFYMNLTLIILIYLTNFWLIPIYGIEGASIATVISLMIYNVLKITYIKFKWNLQPFNKSHMIIVVICAGLLLLDHWVFPGFQVHFIMSMIIKTILYGLLFLLPMLLFKVSDDLKEEVMKFLRFKRP